VLFKEMRSSPALQKSGRAKVFESKRDEQHQRTCVRRHAYNLEPNNSGRPGLRDIKH